jgi:hypothetical protein
MQIEDEASGPLRFHLVQEIGNRAKIADRQTVGFQQDFQRVPDGVVVIDHVDGWLVALGHFELPRGYLFQPDIAI